MATKKKSLLAQLLDDKLFYYNSSEKVTTTAGELLPLLKLWTSKYHEEEYGKFQDILHRISGEDNDITTILLTLLEFWSVEDYATPMIEEFTDKGMSLNTTAKKLTQIYSLPFVGRLQGTHNNMRSFVLILPELLQAVNTYIDNPTHGKHYVNWKSVPIEEAKSMLYFDTYHGIQDKVLLHMCNQDKKSSELLKEIINELKKQDFIHIPFSGLQHIGSHPTVRAKLQELIKLKFLLPASYGLEFAVGIDSTMFEIMYLHNEEKLLSNSINLHTNE